MSDVSGISAAQAVNRQLVDVLPEVATRGLDGVLHGVLARGTVEVLAPALHHYLFACAPRTAGTGFKHMQQHVTVGPLRRDERIVGLLLIIEDVTDRMHQERMVAAGAPAEAEALASLVGQADWRTRQEAVAVLARKGDAVVTSLVDALRYQHHDVSLLSSALDLLSLSDVDVIEPLMQFLDDEDADLRTQAALILGGRRDRRAIPALRAHLADPDLNVAFHVIEALGRLHAIEATEDLLEIAERREFFLSFPAIQALGRLGTAASAPRLVPLLTDEMLRAAVIEALGELGDEEVAVPLVTLLASPDAPTEVITDALAGLHDRYETRYKAGDHIASLVRRTISASGAQRVVDAVQHAGPDRLPGLAKVLGWLEGHAVQRALTRLLGDGRVRGQVIEALVRYGSGVVVLLIEQLRSEDLECRQAAAIALGQIGDRRATAPLVQALGDREVAVVASGALARIGDADAFDALMAHLGEPDPALRQAVVAALNSIGHPDMPQRVMPLLDDQDPIVQESALRIAGYFGYPECFSRVVACCGDPSDTVRRVAIEQLALFDDRCVLALLETALKDTSAPVRVAAAATLGRINHPSSADVLLRALEDPDPWVRYVSVKSLAAVGDASSAAAVIERLTTDWAPHVRLAAVEAVGRLLGKDALEVLEPLARATNQDIARAAIEALAHVDHPKALAVLEQETRREESWRRVAAIEALAARREATVPQILQWIAAADRNLDVSAAAMDALARIGIREESQATEATRVLVSLTAEGSRRSAAITALANLPARRIEDVAAGLQQPSSAVRCAAIEALGRMRQPQASRAIEGALDDAEPSVRLMAIAELKRLGTRSSEPMLARLARVDPDAGVRQAALMALARSENAGQAG